MNTIKVHGLRGSRLLWCAGAASLALAPLAHADMVLHSETNDFYGSASETIAFAVPTAGTFTATLQDLAWPQALSAFTFDAFNGSQILTSWTMPASGAGATYQDIFNVGAGGKFVAHLAGLAGDGALDWGAYSFSLSFKPSAVPLPASDWLLAAGILALAGLTRLTGTVGTLRTTGRATIA